MSHHLIISLDKLSQSEVENILLNLKNLSSEKKERIMLKFNDLISLIGFEGIASIGGIEDFGIMLDPKWYDIPNTLTNYFYQLSKSSLRENIIYLTVHASGGRVMIQAAKQSRDEQGLQTKILAVTVLTSLEEKDTQELYGLSPLQTVEKLARIALESGADGIVCSPLEASHLRKVFGNDFLIVTPGVRFEGSQNMGDQKRIASPRDALESGANDIVMGRDILSGDVRANIERFFLETTL